MNKKDKIVKYLTKGWGFKKKYFSDKSDFWLEKTINHPFIKGLHVEIHLISDDYMIMVNVKDVECSQVHTVHECKYTKKKLINMMVMLSFNDDIETIMHQSLHYE